MAKPTPIPTLHPTDRVRDIAPEIVMLRLGDVRRYEALVEEKHDPDAIHDMRVAARRLRAALKFLDLPTRLSDAVKRLQDALGDVRDLQVQSEALREAAKTGPLASRRLLLAAADELAGRVPSRLPKLQREILRWREKTALRVEQASRDLRTKRRLDGRHYRKELPHRLKVLDRRAAAFFEDSRAAIAHRLRIDAKKLRYEAELLSDVQPEAARILALLVPLQEQLGDLHDMDVRLTLLSEHRRRGAERAAMAQVVRRFEGARKQLVRKARQAAQGLLRRTHMDAASRRVKRPV